MQRVILMAVVRPVRLRANRQHRRIVFVDEEHKRAGGYGVVRQAHLHVSAYIPTWFTSRRYGAPQVVAVKEIKMSSIYSLHELKRVGSSFYNVARC